MDKSERMGPTHQIILALMSTGTKKRNSDGLRQSHLIMAIYIIIIYKYTLFKYLLRTENCHFVHGIFTSVSVAASYIYTLSYHFFCTDISLFCFNLLEDTSSSDSFFQSSSRSFSRFFSLEKTDALVG